MEKRRKGREKKRRIRKKGKEEKRNIGKGRLVPTCLMGLVPQASRAPTQLAPLSMASVGITMMGRKLAAIPL